MYATEASNATLGGRIYHAQAAVAASNGFWAHRLLAPERGCVLLASAALRTHPFFRRCSPIRTALLRARALGARAPPCKPLRRDSHTTSAPRLRRACALGVRSSTADAPPCRARSCALECTNIRAGVHDTTSTYAHA